MIGGGEWKLKILIEGHFETTWLFNLFVVYNVVDWVDVMKQRVVPWGKMVVFKL
ncbi:hypothetical protein Hanom_Chr03g00263791 [Helianthus anomalus]